MEPIRVLQVFTIMNRGGAETMIMNYYRNMNRSKVQFDFLVHREECGVYDQEIEALGGVIYRMSKFNPLTIINYNKELNVFFKGHKQYKIVHAHNCTMNMYDLRAAKKNGVATRIAHSHLAKRKFDFKTPFFLYNNFNIKKFCTNSFACGFKAAKWHFGENSSNIQIMKNAIDSKQYIFKEHIREKVRKQLKIENMFVIGHVGRFDKSKNHTFIVDIFNEIYQIDHNSMLLLVGEGRLQLEIAQKVEGLGLKNNVLFLGSRADVNEVMQGFDVFLFPSLFEGLPVTIIEAQAAGLRCVVSDVIPMEVKITDLVEFISLGKSQAQWAKEILKYKNNYRREDMYDEILKNGYDIKENAEWLQNFYLNEYDESKKG